MPARISDSDIAVGRRHGARLGGAGGGSAPVVDTGPYDLAVQEEYAANSGTSLALTLRQAPVSGNLLVCHFAGKITDANLTGPGAGWTKAVSRQASTSCSAGIWYKISDGTETTITCTQAGAAAALTLLVREHENVPASPLDVTVSNSSGPGVSSLNFGTTAATAQADELAVALLFTGDAPPLRPPTWSDGFDPVMSPVLNAPKMHVAEKLLSEIGTVTTTPAWETARTAAGMIATFKLSAPPVRPAMPVRRLASGTYSTVENAGLTRTLRPFAVSPNRLVVIPFAISDDGSIAGDTTIAPSHGGSLNWTILQHDLGGVVSRHIYLAYALATEALAADAPVLTFAQTGSALWYSAIEIGNVDLANPVAQFATAQTGGGGATFLDITQAVAPAVTSTMIGIVMHGSNTRHVHDAGYHIIQEGVPSDLSQEVSAFWLPSGDQTARISWSGAAHTLGMILEVRRRAA